jgi:hypothetical protein
MQAQRRIERSSRLGSCLCISATDFTDSHGSEAVRTYEKSVDLQLPLQGAHVADSRSGNGCSSTRISSPQEFST